MKILDSGNRREFPTGAVRDMEEGKGRFDLLPMCAIRRLAIHCENGAKKYGERNCEKGIPASSLMDSAMRHLSKYIEGWKDEDHLVSAFWNIAMCMYMEEYKPEMLNLPWQIESNKGSNDIKPIKKIDFGNNLLNYIIQKSICNKINVSNKSVNIKIDALVSAANELSIPKSLLNEWLIKCKAVIRSDNHHTTNIIKFNNKVIRCYSIKKSYLNKENIKY